MVIKKIIDGVRNDAIIFRKIHEEYTEAIRLIKRSKERPNGYYNINGQIDNVFSKRYLNLMSTVSLFLINGIVMKYYYHRIIYELQKSKK